jgi:hypothetical protein
MACLVGARRWADSTLRLARALFWTGVLALGTGPSHAQDAAIAGAWRGDFQGTPASLQLKRQADAFTGHMLVGTYPYELELLGPPDALQGWLSDPSQGGRVPVQASLQGQTLRLMLYLQGPGQAPLSMALQRGGAAPGPAAGGGSASVPPGPSGAPGAMASSMPGGAIDPALVGTWVHSESYTSGTFSAARQEVVTLTADGRVIQGAGRVIGGGDAGSFDSGGGQGGQQVAWWSTANRVLYLNEGAGWVALGGYFVDGGSALIKGASGNKLWRRR